MCCDWIGNGVCFEPCNSVDPDCVDTCGNETLEFGEECDDGNTIDNDLCSNACTFNIGQGPCTEGESMCADGTCSANCDITDS